MPGIEVKLSEGDEGEVLIRSPHTFIRYVGVLIFFKLFATVFCSYC
jgi:hypothetical protein